MADLSISETQFVFTYFHHYLNLPRKTPIHFVFPSLPQEGDPTSQYAGADLVVLGHVYIQFKMPELLSSGKTKEIDNGSLPASYSPFFRFDIKNSPTGSGPGQYDLLLNRTRASTSNIVKYVSVIFDENTYSRNCSSLNFWYNTFLNSNPTFALLNFATDVEIKDILASAVAIGPTDNHRICYNYSDLLAGNPVHIFSDKGLVKMQKGVAEYDFNKEDFTMAFQGIGDVQREMSELSEITGYKSPDEKVSFREMQNFLMRVYNIYWIPYCLKAVEVETRKNTKKK
jgi:hypothetical protein